MIDQFNEHLEKSDGFPRGCPRSMRKSHVLREPLNKPESSATRLLLRLSLLDPGPPKSPQSSRGLVQKFLRQGLLAIVGLLYLCSFKPARADLIVCNNTSHDLDLSVGYYKHVNNGWTATGHYEILDGGCSNVFSSDLNGTFYFYAQTSSGDVLYGNDWEERVRLIQSLNSSDGKSYLFCVDKLHDYETIWDGDENLAYYKDLVSTHTTFRKCTDLGGDRYKKAMFDEVNNDNNYDHCIVSLQSDIGSSWRTLCWN